MNMLQAKELGAINEDELIIQGLLFDEYKAYENSRQIFGKLYDATGEKEYLFREMTSSLLSGSHISQSIKRLKIWDKKHPDSLEVRRLLIPLYLSSQQTKEAKSEAELLAERSSKPSDLDLASNPYLYSGEFKKALTLLNKSYEKTHNGDVLLRIAVIMDEYTGERKKAIQLLEMHRRMNRQHSLQLYYKLLSMYVKENDVDGVLEIYKLLYSEDKNDKYLKKIIDAYAYKGDIDGAIAFLEKNRVEEKILYTLYKSKKYFDKALLLADKFYKKENNAKWLAEKAILLFENTKDKNDTKMLSKVIFLFDEAISLGIDDSIYLNYYGYTLIDKKLDIKKGMKIIKEALKQQPDNTYYLDSLAWGYYIEHKCKKAYKTMKKVIQKEGLSEPEIIEHWDLIKKCK
jgi:tetratricopeptide (TPR) repeat protein